METTKHKIGEHTYEIQQLGAKEGLRMFARLTKLAGPAMAQAAVNPALALHTLAKTLDPEELLTVAEIFARSAKVLKVMRSAAGAESAIPMPLADVFDAHFVGLYDELIAFVALSAMANFGKSIARGKALSDVVLAAAASLSPSPSTSTGGSGGS